MWTRIADLRRDEECYNNQTRNSKQEKAEGIGRQLVRGAFQREHGEEHDRPNERAELVHDLLKGESLARPDLVCGKRRERVLGGMPDGFAETLYNDDAAREDPAVSRSQSESRNGEQVDAVAENGHEPVSMRLVADESRGKAQRVSDKLAETRNKPDRGGRGSEKQQKRSENASGAFVAQVGEQTDHAEQHQKGVGRLAVVIHFQAAYRISRLC